MTVKQDEVGEDDLVVTLSDDGKTAGEKAKPTKEELEAAAAKKAKEAGEEDDGDDDHQEDERHAAGSGESAEEAEERRKNRADARRQRRYNKREKAAALEAENVQLHQRLEALEGRVTTVDQNNGRQTLAIVDQRISEAGAARDAADAALEEAITKQDGKTAREAIKARDLATEAIRQLAVYKAAYEHQQKQQPQQQPQGPSRELVAHARQFKADNPWIELNPDAADDDSKKVHRLDASVRAAGYDPATPEYWEELQDRVDRAFPAKLADMVDDEDAGGASGRSAAQAKSPARAPGRRGPAMSGGRSTPRLGKNDIVVPNALRDAAGKDWNDPAARADIIKRYKVSLEKYGAQK